jgi:uncharacterized protein (TIGR03437 family)
MVNSRRPPAYVLAVCAVCIPLAGQTAATIDIDATSITPIHPNFSGINDDVGFAAEYWDYSLNTLAAKVGYGWVRFPAGAEGDIYNWQTGEEEAAWFAPFANLTAGPSQGVIASVFGKGGAKLIDAANRANFLGATLIICANGFTDSPESIGKLAAYVKANNISVGAWELANEAYLFPEFFATATAYLDKMKPYRDAIKAVDPNAVVAIFVRDLGNAPAGNSWDQAIAAYPNKYWDAITFHHYPPPSSGAFTQWMADEAAALANKTDVAVTSQLLPIGPAGVKFLVTEFDPSIPNDSKTGAVSITDASLWGGIYASEFLMRMSTVPGMLYAGPHSLIRFSGVLSTDAHSGDVMRAANQGNPIDTISLDFGYYVSAQANGIAVLNNVINRAVNGNKTAVTGGAMVAATGITGGVPALYAASYTSAAGGLSVVITNKSAAPHQVSIRVNGSPATGTFPLQFVSGSDPSAVNTPANPNAVSIQTGSSTNPVTVLPYSVMRVDLKIPPVVSIVNSASFQAGPVAPQQLVTAFGEGFAAQTITAPIQPLPTMLGDTSILITDNKGTASPAPLYYVSPGQASFLIPQGAAAGSATLKVTRSGETVLTGSLTISAVSPGLYTANGNGAGVAAAAYFRSSAPNAAVFVFSCRPNVALSCLSTPISLGAADDTVYMTFYGSGIRAAQSVQMYVGGQSVPVLYAGAQGQYDGLDQVNISVPRSLAGVGEASVYVVADGKTSNMTTIKIQ